MRQIVQTNHEQEYHSTADDSPKFKSDAREDTSLFCELSLDLDLIEEDVVKTHSRHGCSPPRAERMAGTAAGVTFYAEQGRRRRMEDTLCLNHSQQLYGVFDGHNGS